MILPFDRLFARAGLLPAVLAPAFLALAACTSSQAQDETRTPVKSVAETVGMATTPPEPAGFVKATRPAQTEYLPVGVTPPPRAIKPKTPAQVKALESELAATRARTQAQGR